MKIRLTKDLPLESKHGCFKGREFEAIKRNRKMSFMGDAGEECMVFSYEYEYCPLPDATDGEDDGEAVLCIECGGSVCICEDGGRWAAHCMDCDNAIGKRGVYDPCAATREDAERQWAALNAPDGEDGGEGCKDGAKHS